MDNSNNLLSNVDGLMVKIFRPGDQPPIPSHNFVPNVVTTGPYHHGVGLPVPVLPPTSSAIQSTPQPIRVPPVLTPKPVPCQTPSEENIGIMVPVQALSQQEQDEEEDSDLESDGTLEMHCSTASQLLKMLGPKVGKILNYSKNKRDKLRRCKASNKVLVDQLKELEEKIVFSGDENESVVKKAKEDVQNAQSEQAIYMNKFMVIDKQLKDLKAESTAKNTLIESLKKTVTESEMVIKEEKGKVNGLELIKKRYEEDLELKQKKIEHAEERYEKKKKQCDKLKGEKTILEETIKQLRDCRKEDEIKVENLEAERNSLKLRGEQMQATILKLSGQLWDLEGKVEVFKKEKEGMLTLEQVMNNSPYQLMKILDAKKQKQLRPSSSSSSSSSESVAKAMEENEDNESGNSSSGGGEGNEIEEDQGTNTAITPSKHKRIEPKPVDMEHFQELFTERVNATPEVNSSSGVPDIRQRILSGRLLRKRKKT